MLLSSNILGVVKFIEKLVAIPYVKFGVQVTVQSIGYGVNAVIVEKGVVPEVKAREVLVVSEMSRDPGDWLVVSGQLSRFVTFIVMFVDPEQFEAQMLVILKLSSDKIVAEYVALQGIFTPDIIVHVTAEVPG